MKNTKNELINEFNRILIATDSHPRPMTDEEYKEFIRGVYTTSGESTWGPEVSEETVELDLPKATEEENLPGWPKKIRMSDGSMRVFNSPKEWMESVKERFPKTETPEKKFSDEEVMEMIKEDPSNVVTNLMLQRKPEYKHLMYPMLKSFVNWMTETGVNVKKGTLPYEETAYMLNELEKEIERKEAEKSNKD